MTKAKKIETVLANETVEFEGPVEIMGDIEAGATIKVKKGGLTIHGNVAQNVRIRVSGASTTIRGSFNGDIIIQDHGNIVINGQKMTASSEDCDANMHDLIIKGSVANNVTLVCENNIELHQDARDFLNVKADNNFTAQSIGNHCHIECDYNVTIQSAGHHAEITCDNNLRAVSIGKNSILDVDNNATIGTLDDESNLSADNNIVISSVGRNCVVEADNNLIVQIAEASAALKAGNRKQVARIVGLETPASRSPSPSKNRFNF